MANANTEIDLTKLHDAIVADIRAAFPMFELVKFYPGETDGGERERLPMPACVLELTEFETQPDDEPGTGQIAVMGSFEAELIIGFRTERAKHAIRHLAAAMGAWLHKRRWTNPDNPDKKLPTGPALVVGAYRDDFSGRTKGERNTDLDQFEVWRVEWRQLFHLGAGYSEDGVVPVPVFSWSPEVGLGHENDYQEFGELTPDPAPNPDPDPEPEPDPEPDPEPVPDPDPDPEPEPVSAELLVNADLSAGTTGWTAGNGALLSAAGGVLTVTRGDNVNPFAYQAVQLEAGKTYEFRAEVVEAAAQAFLRMGTTPGNLQYFQSGAVGPRVFTRQFVATETGTAYFSLVYQAPAAGDYARFRNTSLQEVAA